jgi:hypothetical protein
MGSLARTPVGDLLDYFASRAARRPGPHRSLWGDGDVDHVLVAHPCEQAERLQPLERVLKRLGLRV